MNWWIELHIHTSWGSSDAFLTPDELLEEVRRLELDGFAITEHIDFKPLLTEDYQRLYKSYYYLKEQTIETDLAVLPGAEIRLDNGNEFLVYGLILPEWLFSRKWEEAVMWIRQEGGILVQAHPFRKFPPLQQIDGIEIFNSSSSRLANKNCHEWWKNHTNMICAIGSDAHFVDEVGRAVTIFDVPVKNGPDLIGALKNTQINGFVIGGKYYEKDGFFSRFI